MKKKILASIIALATMATCVCSAVACNKGEEPKDETVSSSVQEEVNFDGGLEVEDVTPTAGMSLKVTKAAATPMGTDMGTGVATVAEDAYVLTATVLPADAADKTVTYSAAWSNPNSSWAKGKTVTDYVTVTQSSTGSLTATATCKQAFGEPIIVTVVSNDNAAAKATATLHYRQKIAYYEIANEFTYIDTLQDYTQYGTGTDELSGSIYVDFDYDDAADGAVEAGVTLTKVYTREYAYNNTQRLNLTMEIEPTAEFSSLISSIKDFQIGGEMSTSSSLYAWSYYYIPCQAWFDDSIIQDAFTTPEEQNALINALISFKGVAYMVKLYNDQGDTQPAATFNLSLDTSRLSTQKRVENVNLNHTELEF